MVDGRGRVQADPHGVTCVEDQPFLAIREVLSHAAEGVFSGSGAPVEASELLPLSEADRPRLAMGFDYSVPCMALGRTLGIKPDEVAASLAEVVVDLPGSLHLIGAESDGPYLNLRLERVAFVRASVDALVGGTLGRCRHRSGSRRDFCLMRADPRVEDQILGMFVSMAESCSGDTVEWLADVPSDNAALVRRLVSIGAADADPSGLTSAVMMGPAGDRFLLQSVVGQATDPVRIASRLARSGDRVVLLAVGSGNLELLTKAETVAAAAEIDWSEVRVFEARRRWRRLLGCLSQNLSHVPEVPVIDISDERWLGFGESEVAFAVIRALVRLADVNHRALDTAEPDQFLRFARDIHRRLEAAEAAGADENGLLRGGCVSAFLRLAGTATPDA